MGLAELVPGTVFARDFLVRALLAQGGMGAVYRAEQRSTGSAVALKIMLPDLLVDAKSRERFEHEARISSRIRSSHVVKVLAAGIDDATATPWLAMEFLEGQNLADFLTARGPLAPDVVLAVLRQVGHALSAAHAAGVVHCDLKPENIIVAPSQTEGVPFDVKVLDFGIARLVKEGRQSATVTTAVGSPHWLAPEQGVKGKTVSGATDVWAFGLIAFRLLTGRFYWLNANVPDEAFNVYALLGELAGRDPIVPPSERLRALGGAPGLVPPGFDPWFLRCVNRDMAARFATAGEAVAGLAAALATGRAVAATQVSPPSIPREPPPSKAVVVPGFGPQAVARLSGATAVNDGRGMTQQASPPIPYQPVPPITVAAPAPFPQSHPSAAKTELIAERARPGPTARRSTPAHKIVVATGSGALAGAVALVAGMRITHFGPFARENERHEVRFEEPSPAPPWLVAQPVPAVVADPAPDATQDRVEPSDRPVRRDPDGRVGGVRAARPATSAGGRSGAILAPEAVNAPSAPLPTQEPPAGMINTPFGLMRHQPEIPSPSPVPPAAMAPQTALPAPSNETRTCARNGESCDPGVHECCAGGLRCSMMQAPTPGGGRNSVWACRPCGELGQRCCRRPNSSACAPGGCGHGLSYNPSSEICHVTGL
jgi:serine/threonine protein kinase